MKFLPLGSQARVEIVSTLDYVTEKRFVWGTVRYMQGSFFRVETYHGTCLYPWHVSKTGTLIVLWSDFKGQS